MAVVAILAGIAIPAFLANRAQAQVTAARSTLRSNVPAMLHALVAQTGYPTTTRDGVVCSADVTITLQTDADPTPLVLCNAGTAVFGLGADGSGSRAAGSEPVVVAAAWRGVPAKPKPPKPTKPPKPAPEPAPEPEPTEADPEPSVAPTGPQPSSQVTTDPAPSDTAQDQAPAGQWFCLTAVAVALPDQPWHWDSRTPREAAGACPGA